MTTVLIDDRRVFVDGRTVIAADNVHHGLDILETAQRLKTRIHELWLDHDLGFCPEHGIETIMPVVTFLEEQAFNGTPVQVDKIWVHTANPGAQRTMVQSLSRRGYNVQAINADWEGILTDRDFL